MKEDRLKVFCKYDYENAVSDVFLASLFPCLCLACILASSFVCKSNVEWNSFLSLSGFGNCGFKVQGWFGFWRRNDDFYASFFFKYRFFKFIDFVFAIYLLFSFSSCCFLFKLDFLPKICSFYLIVLFAFLLPKIPC